MAESPSHKFGQIIGGLLESVVLPPLERFCDRQGLYLDHQKRSRQARRGRKVRWEDSYGDHHDLDFVIERNGSDDEIGQPVGFIEVAWRRYTKHSRNKAQEIQGAILPLARINEFVTIKAALDFLDMHPIYEGSGEFRKYEILVEFSNGDKVDAHFSTKEKVRAFLSFVATQ